MPIDRVDQLCKTLSYRLFPPLCTLCGALGSVELDLCVLCRSALPDRPLPFAFSAGQVLAGFEYGAPIDGLVHAFKFHESVQAGRLLARLSLPAFEASRPQALIPVPLHIKRLRQRGFNQALELARAWSRPCAVPVLGHALVRARETAVQSTLNAAERAQNVHGAFIAHGAVPSHVALVDDVFTTGATCRAAADALLVAGAQRVDVWCLARVV